MQKNAAVVIVVVVVEKKRDQGWWLVINDRLIRFNAGDPRSNRDAPGHQEESKGVSRSFVISISKTIDTALSQTIVAGREGVVAPDGEASCELACS